MFRAVMISTGLLFSAMPAFAATEAPGQLILRCTVTDENGQIRSDFQPGEKFRYNVYLNVPAEDAGTKVLVDASLTAKVVGFPLGASLPALDVTIPNQAVRDQIPNWDPAYDEATAEGIEIRRTSGLISIPKPFPDGNAKLHLSARFAPDTPRESSLQCDRFVRVRRGAAS